MRLPRVPKITHLQWIILYYLPDLWKSGRALREELKLHGVRQSLPAFYQTMARLEKMRLCRSRKEQSMRGGKQRIVETSYKITNKGIKEHRDTLYFYQYSGEPRDGGP